MLEYDFVPPNPLVRLYGATRFNSLNTSGHDILGSAVLVQRMRTWMPLRARAYEDGKVNEKKKGQIQYESASSCTSDANHVTPHKAL